MASNRPHTLKDQFYCDQRYLRDTEANARIVLQQLCDLLGAEEYEAWVDALPDGINWQEMGKRARQAIQEFSLDADQADYRQTMNDTRSWARGG